LHFKLDDWRFVFTWPYAAV